MASYDVYRQARNGRFRAIKKGFCWPAFFFVSLWAFSRRLYLFGFLLVCLFSCLLFAEVATLSQKFPTNYLASAIRIATQVLLGWYANDIHRWFLKIRGFEMQTIVSANWSSSAIKQHIAT